MVKKEKAKRERTIGIIYSITSKVLLVVVGMLLVPFLFGTYEIASPQDFIKESDVLLYDDEICILGDYIIARIADTKSMDPTLDENSLVLLKEVDSLDEVDVGDIIAYTTKTEFVAHRIIKKDNLSVVVKGDNNMLQDRYKIPEKAVVAVVVGILY